MNMNYFNDFIDALAKINPRKAKKVLNLWKDYCNCIDEEHQNEIRAKLYNYVYSIFTSCLSRECRNELSNICVSINEDSYQIERSERMNGNIWHVGNDGASKYIINGDQLEIVKTIPRVYRKGYVLDFNDPTKIEERDFYFRYDDKLERISSMIDRKKDIISGDYETKNDRVDRNFVELLISFLGLKRLTDEELKRRDNVIPFKNRT